MKKLHIKIRFPKTFSEANEEDFDMVKWFDSLEEDGIHAKCFFYEKGKSVGVIARCEENIYLNMKNMSKYDIDFRSI